jgi:hypothetical protein
VSKTSVALLALAILVSSGQWLWTRMAAHIDMHMMPTCSRRRVQWILTNSPRIQLAAAALAAYSLCAQVALNLM